MDEKTNGGVVAVIAGHVEDIALSTGALLLSIGVGAAFGIPYGLMAAGASLLAYGVWITDRGVS